MVRQMEGVNTGETEREGKKMSTERQWRKMKLGADRVWRNREAKASWGL